MKKSGVGQISDLGWGEGDTSERRGEAQKGTFRNVLKMGKRMEQTLHKAG